MGCPQSPEERRLMPISIPCFFHLCIKLEPKFSILSKTLNANQVYCAILKGF